MSSRSDDVFLTTYFVRERRKAKKEEERRTESVVVQRRKERASTGKFLFSTRTLRSTLRLQRYGLSSMTTLICMNNDGNIIIVVVLIDRPTLRFLFPVLEPAKKRAFVNSPKGSSSPPIRERIGFPITSSRTPPARFFRYLGDRRHYRLASGRYRSRNRLALSGTSNRSRR